MRRGRNYLWLAIVGAVGAVSGCEDATVLEPAPSAGSLRPLPSSSVSPLPTYRIKSFDAGTGPSAAKVADLDGDGFNDIAVVNLQGSLQVLYGDGTGSFARVTRDGLWPSTSSTLGVDAGDLNGDGRNDIAVAFTTQQGAVSVLLNQGNRSFSAPVNYDACSASRSVAIGDLDGDGDKDLADTGGCSKAGTLLNDGQGAFAFDGTYGSGSASRSIAIADFNRDGANDIAYLNQTAGGRVTVLFNNGNGTFGASQSLYAGDLPDDITVGDYDGDGNVDLAIANSYFSQVIVLFGSSDGSFSTGYSELSGGDTPTSITSADFNGDGRLDLAVTSPNNNLLSILTNIGNYDFSAPTFYNVGQAPVDVAAGRLDGDQLPDAVSVNRGSGTVTVLFSVPGASEPPPPAPPPPVPQINLTLSTRKTKAARFVDLTWTGATSARVDIYRNGPRLTSAPNTGGYADRLAANAKGKFTYKVCHAGTQTCSNEASITF
jgi:VCBS repeat protein